MHLKILYRGPLSSCNYDCCYCPFAKQTDSRSELQYDEACLQRFVQWCGDFGRNFSVFFTPWGEALIRRWYRQAIQRLSWMPHVSKVAIQTNLSGSLDWLDDCDVSKVGIWATFHPSQVSLDKFLAKASGLRDKGVSHSVGMVGIKQDFDRIRTLRDSLPEETYLWINAFKGVGQANYYSEAEIQFLTGIDPMFPLNLSDHPSRGRDCSTGLDTISVDGEGEVRRCHFIKARIGNIFTDRLDQFLRPRKCPAATCSCHIGYVHLNHLDLRSVYGDGLLERVLTSRPSRWSESHI